jgi:hypothetical protein
MKGKSAISKVVNSHADLRIDLNIVESNRVVA